MNSQSSRWRGQNGRSHLLIFLIVVIGAFSFACSGANEVAPEAVNANCHALCVADEFVDFYQQHGGAQILGRPISPADVIIRDGEEIIFQVFENVMLEYAVSTQQVQVAELGRWAFEGANSPIVGEVTLEDEFLNFYTENRGEVLLGEVLSPQFEEDGRLVQYFENAQLRWNPNMVTSNPIAMTNLGEAYCESESCPEPPEGMIAGNLVESVEVEASVAYTLLYAGTEQRIFVAVESEEISVDGLNVELRIQYNGNPIPPQPLPPTNAAGVTSGTINFGAPLPSETAVVEVIVYRTDASQSLGRDHISFQTWY